MPTIVDVLKQDRVAQPEWLDVDKPRFDRNEFFSTRTVYYPGCGDDGQPVKLCALSHSAHTFVYVDQGFDWETWYRRLSTPNNRFRGYEKIYDEEVSENQLRPNGWRPNIGQHEGRGSDLFSESFVSPFARFVVLERQCSDENHGPRRFSVLFIGGDGIASYDALYCQKDNTPPPYLVLIQDHGFGGNYDRFDRGSLLELIARRTETFPKFLLVGKGSEHWSGYSRIDAIVDPGGMWGIPRSLFKFNGS